MPFRLEAETLQHALARLEEWDPDAAVDARASLSWLGWDAEGPLALRRYDLMLHLWYELPSKTSGSVEDKFIRAAALGRLLEMTPAAAYAPLCRARETLEQIALWEASDARARRQLGRMLDASGIEPPDTPALAWGSVMGLEEAQARGEVATELEIALEAGTLTLGAPGFKRRQAEVVAEALGRDGRLEAVHEERLQHWRDDRRSAPRKAIVERVADALAQPPARAEIGDALGMARWLLERAEDGIALTQTGALNRALVREVVELRPSWWNTALHGLPNREHDVMPLGDLRELLRGLRLLRRSGRRLVATARARPLLGEPGALLEACATALLAGDTFDAAVAELAAALMFAGEAADYECLERAIHPAIVEDGWHLGGVPPRVYAVGGAIGGFFAGLEALDLVTGTRRGGLELTAAGQRALHIGLRARALWPRNRLLDGSGVRSVTPQRRLALSRISTRLGRRR
jgi:hypothetical protein